MIVLKVLQRQCAMANSGVRRMRGVNSALAVDGVVVVSVAGLRSILVVMFQVSVNIVLCATMLCDVVVGILSVQDLRTVVVM